VLHTSSLAYIMADSSVAYKVVLVRHGESQWNKENRFTGWADVALSEKGHQEAKQAGVWLKEKGLEFDIAYTSVLKRAIQTLWHVLEETDQYWIPVNRRWRLNERMYGSLQGLNKSETAAKHGEEQVRGTVFREFVLLFECISLCFWPLGAFLVSSLTCLVLPSPWFQSVVTMSLCENVFLGGLLLMLMLLMMMMMVRIGEDLEKKLRPASPRPRQV